MPFVAATACVTAIVAAPTSSSAEPGGTQYNVAPVSWVNAPTRNISGSAAVLPDGTTLVLTSRLGFSGSTPTLVVESRTLTGRTFSAPTVIMTNPLPWVPKDAPIDVAVAPDGRVLATWTAVERSFEDSELPTYSAAYESGAWTPLPALDQQRPMAVRWTDDGKARLLTRSTGQTAANAYMLEPTGWSLIANQTDRDWAIGVIGPQGHFAVVDGYYEDEEEPAVHYAVLEGERWTGVNRIGAPFDLADGEGKVYLEGTSPFTLAFNFVIAEFPYLSVYTFTAAGRQELSIPDLGDECCIDITSDERQRLTIFRGDDNGEYSRLYYAQTSDLATWTVRSMRTGGLPLLAGYVGPERSELMAVMDGSIYLSRNGTLTEVQYDTGVEQWANIRLAAGASNSLALYTLGGGYQYSAPLEQIGLTRLIALTAPGAVTALSVNGRKGTLVFTWRPPTNRGGKAITKYEYQIDNGAWNSTKTPRLTLRKVPKGKRVTVTVRAVNSIGYGPSSSLTARGR